jgi:hypothetical protein
MAWPVEGGVLRRSRGFPCSDMTTVAVCVPWTSPSKPLVTSKAERACSAGTMATSGTSTVEPICTRSRRYAFASTVDGITGIGTAPSTTA